MKNEILRALRETDGYVSGQELCRKMGVSRTAVWKNIRALQEDGYEMGFDYGKCRHCNACVTACAYAARSFDEGGYAQVDEALCRHCGLCVSVCSFGALNLSKGQVI